MSLLLWESYQQNEIVRAPVVDLHSVTYMQDIHCSLVETIVHVLLYSVNKDQL